MLYFTHLPTSVDGWMELDVQLTSIIKCARVL